MKVTKEEALRAADFMRRAQVKSPQLSRFNEVPIYARLLDTTVKKFEGEFGFEHTPIYSPSFYSGSFYNLSDREHQCPINDEDVDYLCSSLIWDDDAIASQLFKLASDIQKNLYFKKSWDMYALLLTVECEIEDLDDCGVECLESCVDKDIVKSLRQKYGENLEQEVESYIEDLGNEVQPEGWLKFTNFPFMDELSVEDSSVRDDFISRVADVIEVIDPNYGYAESTREGFVLRNPLLAQYARLNQKDLRKEDREVDRALRDAVFYLSHSISNFEQRAHITGARADYLFYSFLPMMYRDCSFLSAKPTFFLSMYVIDMCLRYLDDIYHFIEGGAEAWM